MAIHLDDPTGQIIDDTRFVAVPRFRKGDHVVQIATGKLFQVLRVPVWTDDWRYQCACVIAEENGRLIEPASLGEVALLGEDEIQPVAPPARNRNQGGLPLPRRGAEIPERPRSFLPPSEPPCGPVIDLVGTSPRAHAIEHEHGGKSVPRISSGTLRLLPGKSGGQ